MKRLGWIVRLSVIVVLVTMSIEARKIPQADLRLHSYDASSIIGRAATMVEFGGYSTPKCRLALSDDGQLFYLTKVHSTCRKLTNRNGIRIICNSNKSVCKTRSELSAFVTGGSDTTSSYSPRPSWCSSSRLNRTERTICSHDTLASLDLKLARVYGSQRSRSNDRAQGYWLRHRRNTCGSDVSCLARAYRERIRELGGNGGEKRSSSSASDDLKAVAGLVSGIYGAYKKAVGGGSSRSRPSSGGSSGGSIRLCVPSIPYKCCQKYECEAKSASGRYVSVQLTKDTIASNCYTLAVYGGNGYGSGSTCSGANDDWSVTANGSSGYTNGLSAAIAWILERI